MAERAGDGWIEWPEAAGEVAYVSAPYSRWETVKVRCQNCGNGYVMPMEGPIPLKDHCREIDWDRLMPFITRFAQGLARACRG